jgi:GDP-L-fucose synthase
MKKVLICGATGFIGRNALEHFTNKNEYEVHATWNKRNHFTMPNVTWHKIDLRNPNELDELFKLQFDYIIQAAATTSGAKDIVERPWIHTTDNAVMNSYIFRKAFETNVKHVIFYSCTVMYQSSEHTLKESDFNANNPLHNTYCGVGHTKLYLEKMCEFYARCGKTKFTAIRHSNIYGPHDKYDLERSHFFGASVTKVMNATNEITVWGTGEAERDILYVDDLNHFVDCVISKQEKNYMLYNCGYGKAYTVKNIIQKIIDASGKKLEMKHDLSQPTIKTSLALDCTLAKNELGWQPQTTLEEGIRNTLAWYQKNI